MPTVDVLLHPVRIRIVQALLDGRALTSARLRDELTDVPTASLYRHIAILHDAGVVEVVAERQIRGAIERSYRLNMDHVAVGIDEARAMSPESHRRAFTMFVTMLLADFDRYLAHPNAVAGDDVTYRQAALWLTDDEIDALRTELAAAITSRMANEPTPGRTKRLITTVVMPAR
jgi:hypothetical protein